MGLAGFPNASAAPQQGQFHAGGLGAGAAGLAQQVRLFSFPFNQDVVSRVCDVYHTLREMNRMVEVAAAVVVLSGLSAAQRSRGSSTLGAGAAGALCCLICLQEPKTRSLSMILICTREMCRMVEAAAAILGVEWSFSSAAAGAVSCWGVGSRRGRPGAAGASSSQ
jgi:hypothetical protein